MPKKNSNPVQFVSVDRAFDHAQIEVQATRDISGWVDRGRGIKWNIPRGATGYVPIEIARQWQVKGYCRVLGGAELLKPVSVDEEAEILSDVTNITLGVNPNG